MKPLRITFLTTGLELGGAEMVLLQLMQGLDRRQIEPSVVSLMGPGRFGAAIAAMGICVEYVGLNQGRPSVRGMVRLARLALSTKPDLIQGWMPHGNFAAQMVRVFRSVPVCWSVHNSIVSLKSEKPLTRVLIRLLAASSRAAARIIYPSHVGRAQHEAIGFAARGGVVIPNGVDADRFVPSDEGRTRLRREIGLAADVPIIGLLARFHPQKDHQTFLRAAALLAESHPEVHYVLAGAQVVPDNAKLTAAIDKLSLRDRVHLLGERSDTPTLHAAFDLETSSSSYGESLSVAILEAMACGVPCVVTDVGDHARVVGQTGRVVPPADAPALAAAWREIMELEATSRRDLGMTARQRVQNEYGLAACVREYESLYLSVAREAARTR